MRKHAGEEPGSRRTGWQRAAGLLRGALPAAVRLGAGRPPLGAGGRILPLPGGADQRPPGQAGGHRGSPRGVVGRRRSAPAAARLFPGAAERDDAGESGAAPRPGVWDGTGRDGTRRGMLREGVLRAPVGSGEAGGAAPRAARGVGERKGWGEDGTQQ